MDRLESIKFLYAQLGKEGLQDLVNQGKIKMEEYLEVVGEECDITLEALKQIKIKFIDSYKHEARMFFPYGTTGGMQRFSSDDILSITLAIEGIKSGVMENTVWKYPNNTYEVADLEYLQNMLVKGGLLLTKCFEVEAKVIAQINEIEDIELLKAYNEKEEFDKLFFVEEQK